MGFFDFMTEDIAIDLGTANTLIIHNDKVVIDSPSIVARDRVSGKIIAVGKEANMMQGKTHENIKTIRPLKDGVIADFDASEKMISMFIKSIPALKKNGQDAGVYIAAFRHVHDRFSRAGADNVRWIWCLNAESVPDEPWNSPLRAYPGDAYVDIVSIDGYNFGTALPNSRWQSFREIYTRPYAMVLRNAGLKKKPLMIGEIGCATVGGDKARWMRDMDKQLRGPFRKVSGVIWFEAAKEADWRMGSSPATLSAARQIWIKDHYRRGEP